MDFWGLAGLLFSDTTNNSLISALDLDQKHKLKHEQSLSGSGSATVLNYDEWREMKVPRISQEEDISKGMLLQQQQRSSCSVFDGAQNMLSFSEPNSHLTNALPYYARKNVGYGVRGVLAGPFTASQWMELEHQALIYKYITVNAPIPSNLLIPIRKALETAAFCYPGANLRHTAYGWGGFHMGFSNNSDPEPGRCRRTDGKKWRCSRDAVADQKYCERHMNRGRYRSRKPVEGQPGHSVSNGPTATANAAVVSTPTATATATTGISHLSQQNQHQFGRSFLKAGDLGSNKMQDSSSHSMISAPSIGLKPTAISVPSEFGLVSSDSLLNPLQKNDNVYHKPQNSLHQFMDDWPHPDKSNFISSNSSPNSERLNLSPLRMGLGVGNTTTPNVVFDERSQPSNWIPVSWETSSGGPLGEVLNHNTNIGPSAVNLMTDGWDSSQQQMTLSPTGVLQKTGFGCFSNSSAGSSPRTDNSHLGSTLITSSLPLL